MGFQGWNDSKAIKWINDIRENIRTGKGPQSLRAMREAVAKEMAAEVAAKATLDRSLFTFSEAANAYLTWARTNKSSWAADDTRLRLHILPALGLTALSNVTPNDIERIKNTLIKTKAPATVRQCLVLIHRVFSFCRQNHAKGGHGPYYMGDIPTAAVRIPPVHNERERFLTRKEADHLVATARVISHDMAEIILLALNTGLRRNEIQSMRWEHVNLENGSLSIPGVDGKRSKGKGVVYLNAIALDLLRQRKKTQGSATDVFPGQDGLKDISKIFRRIADAARLNEGIEDSRNKITFHSLRHTFASWLAQKGTPLLTIKELLRHRSIEMTMRYAHLIPDAKREAVEQICFSEEPKPED
ncbi:MAG: site-specific integrase [Desulfovibrio sp.]|nr:site-specific integrase [Desulfovibrio sp.]MBI4960611.1 site-specific integrase [Desulfovibrio sp.]